MKNFAYRVLKRAAAAFVSCCIAASLPGAVFADEIPDAVINGVTVNDGYISAADITVNTAGNYTAYAAVYEGNLLKGVDKADVTESGSVSFENSLSFDETTQTLKCFLWDSNMTPVAEVYTNGVESPAPQQYMAVFSTDGHVKVYVSDTQDMTDAVEATSAYARNKSTGEIDITGDGQVNFKVVVDDGYEIESVTATPADNYKNLKNDPDGTEATDTYRITKMTDDVTVIIKTKASSETEPGTPTDAPTTSPTPTPSTSPTDTPSETGFTGTFVADEHAIVTVSYTQDFSGTVYENQTTAVARDSDTGEVDTNGTGQINFKVVVDDGYEINSVTATPTDNYKNLKNDPEGTGDTNIYRITKVKGDITVTITTKAASTTTPDPNATESPYANTITFNGTSITSLADPEDVTVDGTTVTITSAGEYNVSGSLTDGQIVVAASAKTDEVTLNLTDVSVTNSTLAPFSATEGKITLLCSGTNTFTDTDAATTDTTIGRDNACVYSKRDLTIKSGDSDGTLVVNGNYNNGIRTKADLEIGNCDVTVTAVNNGIKGDESIKLTKKAGTINITSGGDGIKTDYIPELVTDETTNETSVEGGTITINGGTITIDANSTTEDGTTSNGDGIQADYQLTIANSPKITIDALGDGLKANASTINETTDEQACEGGDGTIAISGGTIDITAGEDGIKAVKSVDISGGTVTVKQSQDGIQINEIVYTDSTESTVSAYVAGAITVSGGTVNITSTEDGIQCGTGTVTVSDGTVTVTSTLDGIQGDEYVNITGGTVTVTSGGGAPSGTASESDTSTKGIKGGNLVNILGGTITLSSYDDAIHSNNTVRISGGTITAASGDDGVHGDYYLYISDDAKIDVTKSYEGIEAAKIYVQGGESYVIASDDGANAAGTEPTEDAKTLDSTWSLTSSSTSSASYETFAGGGNSGGNSNPGGGSGGWNSGGNQGSDDSATYGYMEMSGGLLYLDAAGDGFDSNGDAVVTGGTLLVNQAGNGNGVFDVGDNNNTLTITGGIVVGAGTSDMAETPTSTTGSQAYVLAGSSSSSSGGGNQGGFGGNQGGSSSSSVSGSAGQAFRLTDSSGTEILTYVPSESYQWVLISTPDLTSGTSYTLKYGGSASGGTYTYGSQYGIVTGGTYSGSSSVSLTATT